MKHQHTVGGEWFYLAGQSEHFWALQKVLHRVHDASPTPEILQRPMLGPDMTGPVVVSLDFAGHYRAGVGATMSRCSKMGRSPTIFGLDLWPFFRNSAMVDLPAYNTHASTTITTPYPNCIHQSF